MRSEKMTVTGKKVKNLGLTIFQKWRMWGDSMDIFKMINGISYYGVHFYISVRNVNLQ